jgi:hypothetical protein
MAPAQAPGVPTSMGQSLGRLSLAEYRLFHQGEVLASAGDPHARADWARCRARVLFQDGTRAGWATKKGDR